MGTKQNPAFMDVWTSDHSRRMGLGSIGRNYDGFNVLLCPIRQSASKPLHLILLDGSHYPAYLPDDLPLPGHVVGISSSMVLGPGRIFGFTLLVKSHEGELPLFS